ncbi:hypothetical protein ACFO4E_04480 [Nocardiopsis mangrovi]|uniref:Uncharacterized protein n=1 Tax=Nocardiopsis mangrovi TaxID=1179818 RepID=A0ABV9DTF4_9ACTN
MAVPAATRWIVTALAAPALTASALTASAIADDNGQAGVHPGSPFRFGDPAAIAFPVGAYPEEYDWDDMRDVTFTVDSVQRSGAGSVRYRLVIETPELGRVFGVNGLRPQCFADGTASDDPADLPGSGELEAGTHTYPLDCAVPADTADLEIGFDHPGPDGEPVAMVFTGAVDPVDPDGS